VTIWTTWLKEQRQARKIDAGWIVISKGDKALYFSHPIHRTKNFVKNLLNQAWIAWYRVKNRPQCPICGSFMEIAFGRGVKSRYWLCRQDKVRLDWDYGLPERAKKYLKNLRKIRARYLRTRREERKPTHVAMKIRKPWRWRKK